MFVAYEWKFSCLHFGIKILGIGKYHDYVITNCEVAQANLSDVPLA